MRTSVEYLAKSSLMLHMKSFFIAALAAFVFSGCVTSPAPNAEFVGSVNFSNLTTFAYKRTLITGMDFRESEEILLEELSELVLTNQLIQRGFEQAGSAADFYVVTKWKKAVSSYPNAFQSIDGPYESYNRRDLPSYQFASRVHLTIEIYVSESGKLFWRKELPNLFDAIQLTEERLELSLQRAIENFPERIQKDPNLPSIE
ncbi:MAG TPA: hypothetical protein DCX06_00305 [Opitutae bacterium]|nr:hypothetical protein [Opitutae bacterium]